MTDKSFSKNLIVSLMDLTSLNDQDNPSSINTFLQSARNTLGDVAAVCVYKQFVVQAKQFLSSTNIKVATVINFPSGEKDVGEVVNEAKEALALGADELDLVIPYKEYIEFGGSDVACEMIKECKKLCGESRTLKVIIESGELRSRILIAKVARDAIENGADFIKTSTGKTENGASLAAAEIILKEVAKIKDKSIGVKISGGVRTEEDAISYLNLAHNIMGEGFISPTTFRFGVSGLLSNILNNNVSKDNNY